MFASFNDLKKITSTSFSWKYFPLTLQKYCLVEKIARKGNQVWKMTVTGLSFTGNLNKHGLILQQTPIRKETSNDKVNVTWLVTWISFRLEKLFFCLEGRNNSFWLLKILFSFLLAWKKGLFALTWSKE